MSEHSSPPMSPSQQSLTSNMMTPKQYMLLNMGKFIVEFTGTAMLGLFYVSIAASQTGMLLGYWILTLFGVAISGAHFNPCITLCVMLRKNSNFGTRRLRGVIYIVAQFLGGIASAAICKFLTMQETGSNLAVSPYLQRWSCKNTDPADTACVDRDTTDVTYKWFSVWTSEIAGTFLFVFMIMICTDKKTQFSEDKVINCFIMSASFVAARLFAGGQLVTVLYKSKQYFSDETSKIPLRGADMKKVGPLFNPALAFGQDLLSWYFADVQYLLAPFIGAACALVFYEFVFVKSQEYLADNASDEDNRELHLEDSKGKKDIKQINDEINSQN